VIVSFPSPALGSSSERVSPGFFFLDQDPSSRRSAFLSESIQELFLLLSLACDLPLIVSLRMGPLFSARARRKVFHIISFPQIREAVFSRGPPCQSSRQSPALFRCRFSAILTVHRREPPRCILSSRSKTVCTLPLLPCCLGERFLFSPHDPPAPSPSATRRST